MKNTVKNPFCFIVIGCTHCGKLRKSEMYSKDFLPNKLKAKIY